MQQNCHSTLYAQILCVTDCTNYDIHGNLDNEAVVTREFDLQSMTFGRCLDFSKPKE